MNRVITVEVEGSKEFTMQSFGSETQREFERRVMRKARMCYGDANRLHRAIMKSERTHRFVSFKEQFNAVVIVRPGVRRGREVCVNVQFVE